MKIRPGRGLAGLGMALAACGVASIAWQPIVWLAPAGVAVGLVLGAIDYFEIRRVLRSASVRREAPVVAGRDLPFTVSLALHNGSALPLRGVLRDVTPPAAIPFRQEIPVDVPPGQTGQLATTFRVPVRGKHEFGPIWLRLTGSLGMLEGQQPLPCTGAVRVFPEIFSSAHDLSQQRAEDIRLLDKLKQAKLRGAGSEFESLDEYREGDDPRRIDWRSTARVGRPIVRHFQIERHRDVMIVVDTGRLMGADATQGTKLDCAVDGALMLARVALIGGDRCGVAVFDDRVKSYIPPRAGVGALRTIVEALYDLDSKFREPDFGLMFATLQSRQQKRALVVVLSDLIDLDTTERYRSSLAVLARRHLVLFAALQTPYLVNLPRTPVDDAVEGARAAVAFRTLLERERALTGLRRGGIHVLDVTPNELTVPLVNRFIELRTANVL